MDYICVVMFLKIFKVWRIKYNYVDLGSEKIKICCCYNLCILKNFREVIFNILVLSFFVLI